MTAPTGLVLPTGIELRTAAERSESGKAARKAHPRSALGAWEPRSGRPDPVSLIQAQEHDRVADLLPIRHARMSASPFAFYRGAAAVMADDLGTIDCSGLVVQLCGDAHLSNFGLFGSPDRALVFDVNDFDETHPGPFEWDVLRLAASLRIAGDENGYSAKDANALALTAASAYRLSMAQYAGMDDLSVFYDRVDATFLTQLARESSGKSGQRRLDGVLAEARRRDRWSALRKLTVASPDGTVFADQPPLLVRLDSSGAYAGQLHRMYADYRASLLADRQELTRRYRIIDIAHKVVGVGSVGLRAFVLLMQGRDGDDLLVLQAKQAVASVLEQYTSPSPFGHGERVVRGQRLMQATTDVFLGNVTGILGRAYYVRQLRDMKWSPDIAALRPDALSGYAVICGRALARAHARSGDAIAIAAYLGSSDRFDRAVAAFAERYADQNASDYAAMQRAIADGRLVSTDDEKATALTSIDMGAARLRSGTD